ITVVRRRPDPFTVVSKMNEHVANTSFLPFKVAVSARSLLGSSTLLEYPFLAVTAPQKNRLESESQDKGPAFAITSRLVESRNANIANTVLEISIVSSRSPDLSLRAYHFCSSWGVRLERSAFVAARSLPHFLSAWSINAYFSAEP